MKRYTSIKEVDADQIVSVSAFNYAGRYYTLNLRGGEQVNVSDLWFNKHSDNKKTNLVGGYFIRYADGYESWSPLEAFEAGYREIVPEQGKEALKVDNQQS